MSHEKSIVTYDYNFNSHSWGFYTLLSRTCLQIEMPAKKNSQRKNNRRAPRMRITTQPPLSKGRQRATLSFSGRVAATEAAAGTGCYNFFRLNGPYDPDVAVGGNTTLGLAAMTKLYRSMLVHRALVKADVSIWAGRPVGMICLVPVPWQTVIPTNPLYWPIQRDATSVHTKDFAPTAGAGESAASLTAIYDLPKVFNVSKQQYLDELDYATLTTGNPTKGAYVAVCAYSDSAVGVISLLGTMRISFDIEFFDPWPLSD